MQWKYFLEKVLLFTQGVILSVFNYVRGNAEVLIFFWFLPLLVKINAVTFEVNMVNQSQDIAKKQFQRQLAPPPLTYFIVQSIYMDKIFRILFT